MMLYALEPMQNAGGEQLIAELTGPGAAMAFEGLQAQLRPGERASAPRIGRRALLACLAPLLAFCLNENE